MGLDQYMYAAAKAGQYDEYWKTVKVSKQNGEIVYENNTVASVVDLGYRRKHPNLQGWMEQLWLTKNKQTDRATGPDFNGVELELTWEDIDRLEADIINQRLPQTQGFFFGQDRDAEYLDDDLEFCRRARVELFMGLKVFYNSSW